MFQRNVYTFKNLPVEQKQRKWTDCICTIITAIFALTLFILSFVFFQKNNYYKTNFPVDDSGKTCVYDRPNAKLIYFSDPNDLSQGKYCVKSCPAAGQLLQCNKDVQSACDSIGSSGYSTEPVVNRLGAFCLPVDEDMANKIWANPKLSQKYGLVNSYDIILFSLLFGLTLGILFLVGMMCFPKIMTYAVFFLAGIALLFCGIWTIAKPVSIFNPWYWNLILGIALIIFGLTLMIFFACYRSEIQLASIFLHHANLFLKEVPTVFAYIPLFLLLTAGLVVLFVWQYIAFGTFFDPYLANNDDLYFSSRQSLPLQILNLIQLIWGLQFLRDAFNFVVSGNSVEWYFKNEAHTSGTHCCKPFTRLLARNWGSVAGGSFLNAFFNIFNLASDLRCKPDGSLGKCRSFYDTCCFCDYILQLARSDAYAYINLTGVPYCDAARQCEAMCKYSPLLICSQSCLRLYRIAAHVFLVAAVTIICYFILMGRTSFISVWTIVYIIFFAYCASTYFVDIHANAAEGLIVCYLTQQNCEGYDMYVCPPGLRGDVYRYQQK